ncbi:hypothetical protein GCM10009609_66250 [Pseudonocardia aurantiaca]|uniref:non-specific serine/threonine protein kinase n=1 Tax=Pseudonocardia aurantiaca TaxID=75290 RepID=A0ABW4FRT1_9PSEU
MGQPPVTRVLDGVGGGLLGGRYRLEGRLSAGVADVHRATDLRLQRPVAVHILPPGTNPEDARRIHQDAWTLANLDHPGLVDVHDFAVENHHAYLVTQLVEGPTLDDVLTRERLPLDEITRIGADVADVLAYVHEQGVVHGDLQPSNLVTDRDGRIRVANVGVSGLVSGPLRPAHGTAYLSPEQVRGAHVGPPADVYALGLVLLEAATGRREYPGEGHDAAAARLTNPPAVPRNLSDPLRHALVAMTDIDPARRPTARQVNDILAGGFTEDEQPEPEQRGRTWVWVLALLTLLAVLAAIVLLNSGSRQQPTAPTTPPTTAENTDDGGNNAPALPAVPTFQAPQLPELPKIPDIPSMPNLPDLPNIPTVPDSVSNDAQSLWQQFTDWLSKQF